MSQNTFTDAVNHRDPENNVVAITAVVNGGSVRMIFPRENDPFYTDLMSQVASGTVQVLEASDVDVQTLYDIRPISFEG